MMGVGPQYLHPKGDFVSDHIRDTGEWYEQQILEDLRERVRGGTMIDVGAHIGNHTLYFARVLDADTVWAFEPYPPSVDLLRRNTLPCINVVVMPFALSDERATLALVADPNMGHNHIGPDGNDLAVPVPAYPLDAFNFENVTLLKIDVEGHEPQVLLGAKRTIERSHPLVLIEDWREQYGSLLPGYEMIVEWREAHQTFLYRWSG